ncbi:MAG: hypothetical protein UR28_C0001G0032 [Candidatus Peregrinibacteria bacterium GW2011_GWF2_33_10]|nr:MAG: hypothetical protein UR28_C0001G0032 [Candidatus Peregrinibacteria bacterium GW2011_GWF2_33_10]OGJ44780.1 MAG: hypothetical protein A2263_06090 [Candidatus Peregrinibacteria bacterium RIFOXYA2_FULL_33_21]OGJ46927.1 MAG: hypothetical protein A2272_00080 [Candidatus Peregrinibacteria bacterium RIFOXYA12_FULL_33_12]OGJ50466.1 MAG: hypothetical protein A2307_02715 [Candidatus Peregrinibacteria bacterium RIFOXYB2_FULL_33_20]
MSNEICDLVDLKGIEGERVRDIYGEKAFGLRKLLGLKDSITGYEVPQGFAVPVGFDFEHDIVRSRLIQLLAGSHGLQPIVIRSSAQKEEPGQFHSQMISVDSQQIDSGLAEIGSVFQRIIEPNPSSIGVIVQMAAVGDYSANQRAKRILPDNPSIYGLFDRGFVVDSHSIASPDCMQISVVLGLTSRAVNIGGGPVIIDVDRKTGQLKMVLDRSDYALSTLRMTLNGQRQNRVDYFNALTKQVEFIYYYLPFGGSVVYKAGDIYADDDSIVSRSSFITDKGLLGDNGGGTDLELDSLIRVMQRIITSLDGHLIQIEGSFVGGDIWDGTIGKLCLYQLRDLENLPIQDKQLDQVDESKIIARTNNVMGAGKFRGKLLIIPELNRKETFSSQIETLRDYEWFQKGEYIILFDGNVHSEDLQSLTGLNVFCTFELLPMQSHEMGQIRSAISKGQNKVYAAFPGQKNKILALKNKRRNRSVVLNDVVFESNGREAQLYFGE